MMDGPRKKVFLLFSILSWLTQVKCDAEMKRKGSIICGVYNDNAVDQFCLPDLSGYETWKCTDVDPDNEHNVWIQKKNTICEKPNVCSCFQNDWYDRVCECINPRKPPSFPPTGVIRWNGTLYYDNGESTWTDTVYIPGEVHMNSNGHFLHKWTTVKWEKKGYLVKKKSASVKKVEFEILIPNGKSFLKYTGDESSMSCKKYDVTNGGDLTSIWKKLSHTGKSFKLQDDSQTKKGHLVIENWRLFKRYEEGTDDWKWTVQYDSEKDYAIPIKYYHEDYDGWTDRKNIHELDYDYEPLEDNDESFLLQDYCEV